MFFVFFWRARECDGHSFADVAHFAFLRDAWIRTQRAAIASRGATNLSTHLKNVKTSVAEPQIFLSAPWSRNPNYGSGCSSYMNNFAAFGVSFYIKKIV
jgi:hypothetical protein